MKHSAQGFSLIEMIVVVALIAVFLIPLVFNARQLGNMQALRTSVSVLADDLSSARIASHDAREQKAWGVISIDKTHYQIVVGSPKTFATSQARVLSNGVTIETPFVVWFQIGTGSVAGVQRIKVQNDNGHTYEITINETGAIETHEL